MNKYEITRLKGVDDLLSIYAFIGNSQGDETRTNDIELFKISKGWLSFIFECPMTEEAIKIESERRQHANLEYIKKLKASGEFGKPYTITIHLQPNPIFDEVKEFSKPALSSSRMIILNTNEETTQIPPKET